MAYGLTRDERISGTFTVLINITADKFKIILRKLIEATEGATILFLQELWYKNPRRLSIKTNTKEIELNQMNEVRMIE